MKRIIFSLALSIGTIATLASCQHVAQAIQAMSSESSSSDMPTYTQVVEGKSQQGGTINVGNLAHFDEVSVHNGITLRYLPKGQPSITVTTSRIDPAKVEIFVHDDELIVRYPNRRSIRNEHTVVTITGYSLKDFVLNNGGSIEVASVLDTPGKLSFQVNNGGSISVPGVKASDVETEVNNGGTIAIVNALLSNIDMEVNNGGDISVEESQLAMTDAEVSNGGTITLRGTSNTGKLQVNNGGSIKAERMLFQNAAIVVNNGGSIDYNAKTVKKHAVSNGGSARNHFK